MISSALPVTLSGSSLQSRHREFNAIVNAVFPNSNSKDLESLPEISSIDRLVKIDLASKHRNVEYILRNLKDDNMLFVSRALKCFWLLEPQYQDIINPDFLENDLYPDMIQPAVNKMKHWLQLHLKEVERCRQFYTHYKSDFDTAFKFFWRCSNKFILSELSNVIDKLSYAQLNILVEKCPEVGKLYFEIMPKSLTALKNYCNKEYHYFSSVKHIFKWDGEHFLDIVEKYFNISNFSPFGPSLTNRIMKKYKNRIFDKCELYVSSILHIKSFAKHLSGDEAKAVVERLARADYLNHWFNYQRVEPLMKRLKKDDRSEFKKQIFGDKLLSKIEEWPYTLPSPPKLEDENEFEIIKDVSEAPYLYELTDNCDFSFRRCLKKKSCKWSCANIESCVAKSGKSPLDRLFNRYRIVGFERTFYELSQNLKADSTIQGRLSMMLVLVSKSGGVPCQVEKLMKLLVERYKNETTTLRSAVVRSLMKRCCAWRLPEDVWALIMEFGRDVGLDGEETSPLCREGLHGVIIRHLINDTAVPPAVVSGFMREFSLLSEYNLNSDERMIIGRRLPSLVLPSNPSAFLDCLSEYKKDIKDFPEAKTVIREAVKTDTNLLQRIYNLRVLRRELFRETFCLRQSDEDYLNVLKHDIAPLENGSKFASLVEKERLNHDRFLRSLNLYFNEPNGLAQKHREALEEAFSKNPQPRFARPLCTLKTDQAFISYLSTLDELERPLDLKQYQSLHALRANAHKTTPELDINSVDWKWMGAKAVNNNVSKCRSKDRGKYIEKLLSWKRTARIALRLSMNTAANVETFVAVSSMRTSASLNVTLSSYLTKDSVDPDIWSAVKLLIVSSDLSKNKRLERKLLELEHIPQNIEAEYWTCMYEIMNKTQKKKAMPILCRLENMFHKVDAKLFSGIIKEYIEKDFNIFEEKEHNDTVKRLYVRIIAKYLILYPKESREENVCNGFFNVLTKMEDKNKVVEFVSDFIFGLKYTKAFMVREYSEKVFEDILQGLHGILQIEQYFGLYADLHLTMLLFKVIDHVNKKEKHVFQDSKKAIEVVGYLFGKFIGFEIKQLVSKYFWSIIDLYKRRLEEYLRSYFEFNKGRSYLVTFVIKGILEVGSVEALLLAEYITQREINYHVEEPHKTEILNVLKSSDNSEVKFFLNADILC